MDPKNSLIINRIEYIETDDIIDLNYIVQPTDNNIIRHLVISCICGDQ